jgi:hypothetical protein
VAWSSNIVEGAVVDTYYLNLQNELASRLRNSLAASSERRSLQPGDFLPADTNQLTIYNYRDPAAAWRGLNAAVSSQLEITIAPLIARFFDEFLTQSLQPFGIDSPREFLLATGPEIATARLDSDGTALVLVASIRDRAALESIVRKHLGAGAKSKQIGESQMIIAADEARDAAGFTGDYLIIGGVEDVRRCLQERDAARTLRSVNAFQQASRLISTNDPANAYTYTIDYDPARRFISFLGKQKGLRNSPPDAAAFQRSLSGLPFALSETRLVEGGFEKKTRSSFGQFGAMLVQLAGDVETEREN